ncbi:LacI family DNA-binding transcriptional regulator [Rubritalea marina]|uniref:LacI family DNA-binding transcriptional regulator n=1 Tax=Rubritalea marina TaxID=361055 RepID=UPI0003742744|nr:LacI family DNA-binding transcriptional regulator [Rubritalea marina]
MTDLAEATGLSKMTISRVFSGSGSVKSSTRERVIQAAARLGYEYNALAGNFASGRSQQIGIAVDFSSHMGCPFYADIFRGAHPVLEQADYHTVLYDTGSKALQGKQLGKLIQQRRIDGLLHFFPQTAPSSWALLESEARPSMVVIGHHCDDDHTSWVDLDLEHSIRQVVNHLHLLGHQRIGFISGPSKQASEHVKSQSFAHIRQQLNLPWNNAWEQPGEHGYNQGREAAHRILSRSHAPTAIITSRELSALGACDAARSYGLTPGKEISIASIEGQSIAAGAEPSITSMSQPLELMGRQAAQLLLQQLNKSPDYQDGTHAILRGQLTARASTGPPILHH